MVATLRDRITVIPPEDETVTVDILADDVSVGTAFAANKGSRTLTLPAQVTDRTSFYFAPDGGPYTVSMKLNGVEVGGDDGPVVVSSFPAEFRVRVDIDETVSIVEEDAGNGGSSAVAWHGPFTVTHATVDDTPVGYTPPTGAVILAARVDVRVNFDSPMNAQVGEGEDGFGKGWINVQDAIDGIPITPGVGDAWRGIDTTNPDFPITVLDGSEALTWNTQGYGTPTVGDADLWLCVLDPPT